MADYYKIEGNRIEGHDYGEGCGPACGGCGCLVFLIIGFILWAIITDGTLGLY